MNRDALSVLGRPEYSALFAAARARLERNGVAVGAHVLRLRDLDLPARDGIAGLLGRARTTDGPVTVRLDALDAALRRSAVAAGLLEVLEALGGPVHDRRAARALAADEREALWARLRAHPVARRDARVGAWLDQVRRSGTATRAAGGGDGDVEALVARALDVLGRLPADGVQLARLAADVTGDSHALDRNRPLGSLAVHAIAFVEGGAVPSSAAGWRRLWGDAGVVCDDLSCDVLVLNLPLLGDDPLARITREGAGSGEPLRLTLRQLARGPLTVAGEVGVFVCENPVVVAHAADRLGAASAPLVCVDGIPNTAARRLLTELRGAGASLRYHGDFDWGGLRIGSIVIGQLGAQPWRFGATDYRAAVARVGPAAVPLGDRGLSALWDGELPAAMADAGVAIYEEQVLDDLTADLARLAR